MKEIERFIEAYPNQTSPDGGWDEI